MKERNEGNKNKASSWSVQLIYGRKPSFIFALLFSSVGSVHQLSVSFCWSSQTNSKAQFSILKLKTLLKYSSCSSVNMVFQSPTLPGLTEQSRETHFDLSLKMFPLEQKSLCCSRGHISFSFSKKKKPAPIFKIKEYKIHTSFKQHRSFVLACEMIA